MAWKRPYSDACWHDHSRTIWSGTGGGQHPSYAYREEEYAAGWHPSWTPYREEEYAAGGQHPSWPPHRGESTYHDQSFSLLLSSPSWVSPPATKTPPFLGDLCRECGKHTVKQGCDTCIHCTAEKCGWKACKTPGCRGYRNKPDEFQTCFKCTAKEKGWEKCKQCCTQYVTNPSFSFCKTCTDENNASLLNVSNTVAKKRRLDARENTTLCSCGNNKPKLPNELNVCEDCLKSWNETDKWNALPLLP